MNLVIISVCVNTAKGDFCYINGRSDIKDIQYVEDDSGVVVYFGNKTRKYIPEHNISYVELKEE